MFLRTLYHPALRNADEKWLHSRSSWFNFFYPAEQRIQWFGDVQLYCRNEDYQALLDAVPCPTEGTGIDRRCALHDLDLDEYRIRVQQWLFQFDEWGRPRAPAPAAGPVVSTATSHLTGTVTLRVDPAVDPETR